MHKPGFNLLISVLVLGAVASAISVVMLLVSVGNLRSSLAVEQGTLARTYADACAEEGVYQLWLDTTYSGNQTLTFADGSCTIQTVTGSGDTNRTIQAVGTVADSTRRIEVEIATVQPQVSLTSWLDVVSF